MKDLFPKKGQQRQVDCGHYLEKSFMMVAILFSLAGCIGKNKIEVNLKNPKKLTKNSSPSISVSNIQVLNHQVVITGTNLSSVSGFQVKEGSSNTSLQIESKTPTTIIANTVSDVTFATGKVFDFILSNAQAASTFTVNFSLCDSLLGGKGFDCTITPTDKQVLAYDALTGKWKPKNINGLDYRGTWDASTDEPAASIAGEYWIVSVAHGNYDLGDWIVFNGTTFDKIDNSQAIISVFGRTGAVTASKGDYVLNKLGDVDLSTTPPVNGNVLKYNGSSWVPGTITTNSGTVTGVTGSAPIVSSGGNAPVISITQATASSNGYLSSTDWNTFNSKQATIAAGATTQYFRGDKSWQTLDTSVVSENSNLYFTNARAKDAPLTGLSTSTSTAVSASDSIVVGVGKLQAQLNNLGSSVLSTILTGLSMAGGTAITAADTVLSAFGKLQAQVSAQTTSIGNKADRSNTVQTITAASITGLSLPLADSDAANKSYVDSMISASSYDPQTPSEYYPTCPANYISVPAIPYYPGPSFCVMKYEAKTGSASVAATTASAGAPQVNINRNDARAACRLIGPGYDLISNAQWQTIARNIADQGSNWSTGTAYSGELNRGHSDNAPSSALAASIDTDGCNGTGQTCSNTVWDSQRRTHTLSNGEMIWDIAGNVYEWVSDNNTTAQGGDGYISTMNTGDNRQKKYGNDRFCASPSSTPYCGMGHGWINYTAGAVLRGGTWGDAVSAGVFASYLSLAPANASTSIGFRCVFVP